MIKMDYAAIVANAKAKGASSVDFEHTVQPIKAIAGQQDTVTLSDQALALMNGNSINTQEPAPTYIRPETASSLLAKNKVEIDPAVIEEQKNSQRFSDVMQNILDQRTGIDRKKLEEINAMIEEIAANEDMSPKEKDKTIEMLEKMREEIIKESIEIQQSAKQKDENQEDV